MSFSSSQCDQKLWDSFQDPPTQNNCGSAHENNRFSTLKQLFKFIAYLLVFFVVLIAATTSKMSFLLMCNYVRHGYRVQYCNETGK